MTETKPFSVNLGALQTRPKDSSAQAVERVDRVGESHGFVSREPGAKHGGRKPTPRTKQLHAWVEREIAQAIAEEADRTGKTQGELIAEAWRVFR